MKYWLDTIHNSCHEIYAFLTLFTTVKCTRLFPSFHTLSSCYQITNIKNFTYILLILTMGGGVDPESSSSHTNFRELIDVFCFTGLSSVCSVFWFINGKKIPIFLHGNSLLIGHHVTILLPIGHNTRTHLCSFRLHLCYSLFV